MIICEIWDLGSKSAGRETRPDSGEQSTTSEWINMSFSGQSMMNSRNAALRAFGQLIKEDTAWPRPVCPTCGNGHVGFEKPTVRENGNSKSFRGHDAWEPEWVYGTFEARGVCENVGCAQEVTILGTYRVEESPDDDYRVMRYSELYKVEYFSPPLTLLPLPVDVPDDVRAGVERAAKVLFVDPGLAATALRAAVELFLDTQGIPISDAKGHFVSLDARIKRWSTTNSRLRASQLFLAVKWIGNEGTHGSSDLVVGDVIDGLEFIDEAFHELFVGPDVEERARAVNANKGRLKSAHKK